MTVYTDLLKERIDAEESNSRPLTSRLVAEVVARAARLNRSPAPGTPAGRLGLALAYDAALARLSERLGLEHHLTDPFPPVTARRDAERALADRLPGLSADPGGPESEE